jgi:hypothetical protein
VYLRKAILGKENKVDVNVFITSYYENPEMVKTSPWQAGYLRTI